MGSRTTRNRPYPVLKCSERKERKHTIQGREGWEDGTPPPHRDFDRARHKGGSGLCPQGARVADAVPLTNPQSHPHDQIAKIRIPCKNHAPRNVRRRTSGQVWLTPYHGRSSASFDWTDEMIGPDSVHVRQLCVYVTGGVVVSVSTAPSRGGVLQLRGNPVHGALSEARVYFTALSLQTRTPQG